jgi:transcriptional regulator with XRE-family HTH domain
MLAGMAARPKPGAALKPSSGKKLSPAEMLIGLRIRECRVLHGLSQQQLAELVGVTYQQIFKYEHGVNRVSAGRLYEIAQELDTPLESFFDGLEKSGGRVPHGQRRLFQTMRSIGEIKSEKRREAIGHLVRVLAGQP